MITLARKLTGRQCHCGTIENSIISTLDKNSLNIFCTSTIGPLVRHDSENGTELLKTLETYLRHDCSVIRAAEELYIHPSTVKHRIRRASNILGSDRLTFGQKTNIYLAMRILETLVASKR
jgi:purine catabolism regulator